MMAERAIGNEVGRGSKLQPTQKITETRRRAKFITPIPKPRKRKDSAEQASLLFDEGEGLSTVEQQYDHTAVINAVRAQGDHLNPLLSILSPERKA